MVTSRSTEPGTNGAAFPVQGTGTALQSTMIPVVRGRPNRTVGVLG